jgi:hypothetical protein
MAHSSKTKKNITGAAQTMILGALFLISLIPAKEILGAPKIVSRNNSIIFT